MKNIKKNKRKIDFAEIPWSGPFTVKKILKNNFCVLEDSNGHLEKKKQNLKNLKPFKTYNYKTDCDIVEVKHSSIPMFYNPVDEEWQTFHCNKLNFIFEQQFTCLRFRRPIPLTQPLGIVKIEGDGNCWFRAISYVITGSEKYHNEIRCAVVKHMAVCLERNEVNDLFRGVINLEQMMKNGVWATEAEIFGTASLLKTNIYVYTKINNSDSKIKKCQWQLFAKNAARYNRYSEEISSDERNIYITNDSGCHYNVVLSVHQS